ncbi:MAG: hypothetical protein IPO26_01735 [Saprospiraceae bacterium]|nr:hypothetical protein [Saprospiraceae bacterium]
MIKFQLIILGFFSGLLCIYGQNIGINNTDPQSALDINGDLRLRTKTITLPIGVSHDVDLVTDKAAVYNFDGGALDGAIISGFTGGVDGRIVTIFNNGNSAIQLYHEASGSLTSNRIMTGTGNNAVIYQNGSVTMRYDGQKMRWTIVSNNYTDGLSATITPTGNAWSINGNVGTDSLTNFLGTLDNKPLQFRVNNTPAGHIGNDGTIAFGKNALSSRNEYTPSNIAIGDSSLSKLNSIYNYFNIGSNLALGHKALANMEVGHRSTAIGYESMYKSNVTGDNTSIGYFALRNNISGYGNIAIGVNALKDKTTSTYNIAIGNNAASHLSLGNQNVCIGPWAGNKATNNNVAIGFLAMNGTGSSNIAIGANALGSNDSLNNMVAIGYNALKNTKNMGNGQAGYNSVAIGSQALENNFSGSQNTAVGTFALVTNYSGSQNTALGSNALFLAQGNNNLGIGFNSGRNIWNGDDNTFLGQKSGEDQTGGYNNIFVGSSAGKNITSGSDNIFIGTKCDVPRHIDGQIKIGGWGQQAGIGLDENIYSNHTLTVGRKTGTSLGALRVNGISDSYSTSFNYGDYQSTYIRSGHPYGDVHLGDTGFGFVLISNDQNSVGIGTGTPAAKLTVRKISNDVTPEGSLALYGTQHGSHFHYSATEDTYIRGGKDGSKVIINDGNLGNVGIGNSSPLAKLSISKTSNIISPEGSLALYGSQYNSFFHYSSTEDTYIRGGKDGSKVIINDGNLGNVGIGTSLPTHKLSVNGTIRSKEVIVEMANWPDYVFASDYKLPHLHEVEKHIIENKHLPNIPKASEIEDGGLYLGDVQKKMMEKIEELTLYIIQQNKILEVQNERIIALENKLKK